MKPLTKYIVVDLETTGLDAQTGAEIMEVGMVRVEDGKITEEYETLLAINRDLPEEISLLTGIWPKDLEGAPNLASVKNKIREFIGDDVIVGHNVGFDVGFLEYYGFVFEKNGILDTCALAECLVSNVESFSLETLSQYFQLPKEDAHRAIGDVRTTHRLLEKLRTLALAADGKTREEILEKSEQFDFVPGRIFIGEQGSTSKHEKKVQAKIAPLVLKNTEFPKTTLVSVGPREELSGLAALVANGKTLVVARSSQEAHTIAEQMGAVCLESPNRYLALEKFRTFEANLTDNLDQLYFWLKLKLWQTRTTHGMLGELSLRRQDQALWPEVSSDDPAESSYFGHAQETAQKSETIFTTLQTLTQTPEYFTDCERVIFLGTESLADRLAFATEQVVRSAKLVSFLQSQPQLSELVSRVDLCFGIIGSLVKDFEPGGPYPVQELITPVLRNSVEFRRASEASQNLIETFEQSNLAYLKETAKNLRDFFLRGEDYVSWIVANPDGEVTLHSNHREMSKVLTNLVSDRQALYLSAHLFSGVIDFVRTELGLSQAELVKLTDNQAAKNQYLKCTLERNVKDWELGEYIIAELEQSPRPTIIVCNSKKYLLEFFHKVYVPLREQGRVVLAEGATGGLGKNLSKWQVAENPILLVSEYTFRRVHIAEQENLLVLLHKVPFEWASPYNRARMEQYEDSFAGFSVPQALLKLDELIVKADSLCQSAGELRCLDSRISQKSYGAEFVKVLEGRSA